LEAKLGQRHCRETQDSEASSANAGTDHISFPVVGKMQQSNGPLCSNERKGDDAPNRATNDGAIRVKICSVGLKLQMPLQTLAVVVTNHVMASRHAKAKSGACETRDYKGKKPMTESDEHFGPRQQATSVPLLRTRSSQSIHELKEKLWKDLNSD